MAAPTATTSSAVRLLAGELLDLLHDRGHAGHAAHEHDVVDVLDALVLGVVERLPDRADDALDQRRRELVELGAREPHVEVLRAGRVGGDERQVDLGLLRGGELDLGLLGGLVEALQGHAVLRQVDALVALELRREPVDDGLVEVVAAEVVVARGGLDLEDAVADLEDRHVERAAAEVEHQDRLVALLVEPVGERRRGRLVDDALDVQAGDPPGVLGRLALIVVEVRGDGDHRGVDGLAEVRLGVRLELLQDHRGDLRRRVLLAAALHARVAAGAGDDLVGNDRLLLAHLGLLAAHEALDGEDRVLGIGDGLALGDRAHEPLAALGERDDRRRGATTLRVLDHGGLAALEDGHARVRRAQVDADGLGHVW
jgi:NAD-specific glutamate dehydrogenase